MWFQLKIWRGKRWLTNSLPGLLYFEPSRDCRFRIISKNWAISRSLLEFSTSSCTFSGKTGRSESIWVLSYSYASFLCSTNQYLRIILVAKQVANARSLKYKNEQNKLHKLKYKDHCKNIYETCMVIPIIAYTKKKRQARQKVHKESKPWTILGYKTSCVHNTSIWLAVLKKYMEIRLVATKNITLKVYLNS